MTADDKEPSRRPTLSDAEPEPVKAQTEVEPGRSLVFVVGILGLIGAFIVLLTAPAQVLVGDSARAVTSAMHGLVAGLFMISTTIALYQGYRLFESRLAAISELQIVTAVTATLSALTIFFGNWIYVAYRASGGPGESLLNASPAVHEIFFEFKEFMALFTLPLAVAAAYIAYAYGRDLFQDARLRMLLAVLIVLVFFYFLVAFGLGAAITKLRPA